VGGGCMGEEIIEGKYTTVICLCIDLAFRKGKINQHQTEYMGTPILRLARIQRYVTH